MDTPILDIAQIQGNVLAGFNKDHQAFLFVAFTDPARARSWLAAVNPEVATTDEVQAYNSLFRTIHQRRGHASNVVQATWMNLALSASGLRALGLPAEVVDTMPEAFRQGLTARAEQLGHVGPSAPAGWRPTFQAPTAHAVLIVAADADNDLEDAINRFVVQMGQHGVTLLDRLDGRARADEKGHEHFGFKDGVSQPGVLGFTDAPHAGQDLIQPGEFVIGYPTEPTPVEPPPPPTNPSGYGNPAPPEPPAPAEDGPGPNSAAGPDWATNGSFLVIQRLNQDVSRFETDTKDQATAAGIETDLFRSKLVGRHKSGCPMEPVEGNPDTSATDVGLDDPTVLDDERINVFGYAGDPDGTTVPRGAHIRKTNPRDQDFPGAAAARRHRILRRGITFGDSYRRTAPAGSPGHRDQERGLLFACYQASIEQQFEFIQQSWVNHPNFPAEGDGADPILSEAVHPFALPGAPTSPFDTGGWITMTGGEYFFQPSIAALQFLAQDPAV